MRDINIKKDSDGARRLIAVLVLGGVAFIVMIALAVVGWLIWGSRSPQTLSRMEPANLPAAGGPVGPPPAPPPLVPENLQSLPPPPALEEKPSPPPPPPAKRLDIVAVRSFAGHDGAVLSLAFSPDQHRLVSGGDDRTVRLWDRDSGARLAILEGHAGPVRDVAFAPDGQRIASASADGTLRLWDVESQKTVRTFTGHDGAVCCLAFTADGKHLLSGGDDRSLRVWDVEIGRQIQGWYGHEAAVLCLSISADGTRALTGSADGGALCWDLKTGRQLCYLHVGGPVHFALFTSDGRRAVVGGDRATRLCDLDTGEQWMEETGVGDRLRGAALTADGTVVFHGGAGKRLEARVLARRHRRARETIDYRPNQLGQVEAHRGTITCVRVTRDGRFALTAGADGLVKLWSLVERPAAKSPRKEEK